MTVASAPAETVETSMIEAAHHGDLYAWERLVRRYQEPVYRVAYLVVRDTELAEAATHSTFVRAYRALPSYQADLGMLPWLIRIAAGESRQQRRRSTGPRFSATAIPGLAEAAGLTATERESMTQSFDRLGEEDRLVITCRYLFGLSRVETANALSLASGSVEEHLAMALKRLRIRMADA